MIRRMFHGLGPFILLAIVLLAVGFLVAGIVIILLARRLLSPPRMNDGKALYLLNRLTPTDLGIAYEAMNFVIRNTINGGKMNIAGWWMPATAPSERCVIILHGYSDAKVGSIAWAPIFLSLGFNVLAIDLRAHGESDGPYSTAGFYERDDVNQVIDLLLMTKPDETRRLVLFGASLGAAVAAATAAERTDDIIAAVVMDSPFASFRDAVKAHADLTGLPTGPLLRASLKVAQWLSQSNFDAVKPIDTIPKMNCPAMMIVSGKDELLNEHDVETLNAAINAAGPKAKVFVVPQASHLMAMAEDPQGYAQHIQQFVNSIAHEHEDARPLNTEN